MYSFLRGFGVFIVHFRDLGRRYFGFPVLGRFYWVLVKQC
jgi:hypothetical protein